jgi:hypothetical protein
MYVMPYTPSSGVLVIVLDRISHTKEILSMTRCPTCTTNFIVSIGYWPDSQVKRRVFHSCQPLMWIFLLRVSFSWYKCFIKNVKHDKSMHMFAASGVYIEMSPWPPPFMMMERQAYAATLNTTTSLCSDTKTSFKYGKLVLMFFHKVF